jgi:L,D-transpeptidase catalytic domain
MNSVSRAARLLVAALLVLAGLTVPASPVSAGPSVDVHAFGPAPALGAPEMQLNGGIVDIAAHPTANGYWLLGRDGGVFSYGVAFFGSTGGMRLNQPVVGMTPTPDGNGYWFVAEDGGVFSFGSAQFFGSTGGIRLNSKIIGMAATATGAGYWLIGQDGGVFAFGDAGFHGSTGGVWTGTHMVGVFRSLGGGGYVLVGANGSLFSFGDAPHFTAAPMPQGAVDATLTPTGNGAWVVGKDGAVYSYGDAGYMGGASPSDRNASAIAAAAGGGYWIAMVPKPPSGPPAPPNSGSGRRIVYSNSAQRVWLVEADNHYSATFPVSGRRGVPAPGTYRVFSKSVMSSAHNGELRLPYMTRFAVASSGLAIGFHGIPLRANGTPIQGDAELGEFRSAGCVRMNQQDIKTLYNWAPVGTTVVVLP